LKLKSKSVLIKAYTYIISLNDIFEFKLLITLEIDLINYTYFLLFLKGLKYGFIMQNFILNQIQISFNFCALH